jgi:hypothetical protein
MDSISLRITHHPYTPANHSARRYPYKSEPSRNIPDLGLGLA